MDNASILSLSSLDVAIIAAVVSWYNVFSLRQQTTSKAIISCLNIYLTIRRIKFEAEKNKDHVLAEQYYRELTDLCWSKFRLWQSNLIPYHVFYAWMDSRYKSCKDNSGITVSSDPNVKPVTQRSVWESLVAGQYFSQHDDFLSFMEEIHDGKIESAIKSYKKPKLN